MSLVFGVLVTQGLVEALVTAKSGKGGEGGSSSSPSGTATVGGATRVGNNPTRPSTVGSQRAGSISGAPSGSGSDSLRGGHTAPSSLYGPNADDRSGRGFVGTDEGALGFGSSAGNVQLQEWFNGYSGIRQGNNGPSVPTSTSSWPSSSLGQGGPGWFGSIEYRGLGDFRGVSYQGKRDSEGRYCAFFGSQEGQGSPSVSRAPFGSGMSGGTSEFSSGFGGFQGQWNQGIPPGSWNFGSSSDTYDQGFLSESNSFGSGFLDAITGLSNFGNELGLGHVSGSGRSSRFGHRLLALLPSRSRKAIQLYLKYKKRGGRGGFLYFLRRLRLGAQRGLGGRPADSLVVSSENGNEGYGNHIGQQGFDYWPDSRSQKISGSSFGSGAGVDGAFGNNDNVLSQ